MESAYKLAIEILAKTDQFNAEMKQAAGVTEDTADKVKEVTEANSEVTDSFTAVGTGIKTFMAVAVAAAGAIAFLKEAIVSTEGGSDRLEETTSSLKGAWEGLNQTISAGSWLQLIQNIKNTAAATREATVAADALEDILASNTIRKGYLERERDAARISAIEAKDAIDRQSYIGIAIDAQKALTSVTVDEISKVLINQENAWKIRMGWTEEEADYNFKKVREMAGNYEYFFGPSSVIKESLEDRKKQLEYLKVATTGLTAAQREELNQISSTLRIMEIFKTLQDDISKPEQFNEYVETIGAMNSAIAQGDVDLRRMTQQFETLEKSIAKTASGVKSFIKEVNKVDFIPGYGNIDVTEPGKSTKSKKSKVLGPDDLRPGGGPSKGDIEKAQIAAINAELEKQKAVASELIPVFNDLFSSIDDGFKAMAESLINSIKRIAEELLAKAAVFGILKLLFPMGGGIVSGGLMNFIVPHFASGAIVSGPTLAMVGEYSGASADPEVISPLSQLRDMLGTGRSAPTGMKLNVEVGGAMVAYFKYENRKLNNYR